MKKEDKNFLLTAFLSWRIVLFIFLILATQIFPLQKHFLGGGLTNYLKNPYFWAWANFDGEHYLSIAQNGYGFGEQAFFPLFPLMIRFLVWPFRGSLVWLNLSGLIISNFSFIFALFGLYKLLSLEHSEKVTKLAIILLLLFPTSLFFGSVYTESLFLSLVVWSFYFAKKQKWFLASAIGAFASATRIIGLALLPALFIEWWKQKNENKKVNGQIIFLFLIPFGIAGYMSYLWLKYGDPFFFWHALPGFGEQRSTTPILLPQVFYRYIFKVLPNINYSYLPIVISTYLEFLSAVVFLAISLLAFFKMRLSDATFLILGYLLPTLSGSFSSFSRYVLVLFPAFILAASYLSKTSRLTRALIYTLLFICLGIATSLFVRGYWLA